MAVTDLAITLAAVLEWQAPDGDVLLADGGMVRFDPGGGTVTFTGSDSTFGTIASFEVFESGVGDLVEGGTISFAPPADAAASAWWRADLENTRLRVWLGEIDPADSVTLTDAEPIADWLVDTASREQSNGRDVLIVQFMARDRKFFEIRQGNVCSDTFHQSIWPGERGFENCTDAQQFFAWGVAAPPASGGGGSGGGVNGGGNNPPNPF